MAMFEKEKDMKATGPGTIVGANVKLSGVLKDTNDITVHGVVEGEVISDQNVVITDSAKVHGPVSAKNITVSGYIDGSVTATEKLEILKEGKVFGSITVKELVIHSGAVFVGKSTMPDHKRDDAAKLPSKSGVQKTETKPSDQFEVEE